MRVVDGHQSGWHSAPRAAFRASLRRLEKAGARTLALTECREMIGLKGWGQYAPAIQGGPTAAECTILWREDTYRLEAKGYDWITRETFRTGTGRERPGVVATWALLPLIGRDDNLLRVVAHLPASVQDGNDFSSKDARVAAWKDALEGLNRLVCELTAEYEPTEIVVSADWNVDLSRRAWRRRINRALSPAQAHIVHAERGTRGRRVIDAHASTMRVRWRHSNRAGRWVRTTLRVFRVIRPLDHRAVLVRLATRRSTR